MKQKKYVHAGLIGRVLALEIWWVEAGTGETKDKIQKASKITIKVEKKLLERKKIVWRGRFEQN